jgi:hypothetical protein
MAVLSSCGSSCLSVIIRIFLIENITASAGATLGGAQFKAVTAIQRDNVHSILNRMVRDGETALWKVVVLQSKILSAVRT